MLNIIIILLLLWVTTVTCRAVVSGELASLSVAKPQCPEICGSISIPYPFGIGVNCSRDEGFSVFCNDSHRPPILFLESIKLEVLNISLKEGTVLVNYPIITSNCPARAKAENVNLSGSPFTFSDTHNRFTAMGCDSVTTLTWGSSIIAGCLTFCNSTGTSDSMGTGCNGLYCCQIRIPPFLDYINASLGGIKPKGDSGDCMYAFLVSQQWFTGKVTKNLFFLENSEYVPALLDWKMSGKCKGNQSATSNRRMATSCSPNAYCRASQTELYQCFCERGYYGNPYLPTGCQDIDECAKPRLNKCERGCTNTNGSYSCYCPTGYGLFGNFYCFNLDYYDVIELDINQCPGNRQNFSEGSYVCDCPPGFYYFQDRLCVRYNDGIGSSRKKAIILGTCTSFGAVILVLGVWWLWKVIKRRKETKLKEKFFKRNGGLLLQQQVSSDKGNVEATKLFTSKELEQATDNYNANRILGQGGLGTVYKGMLTDGKIVAIKKSKMVDENQLGHFINEVVILSQINHRNVVKLLGCCLETEVPMLVYEFIPNGTLFHYIHDQNEEFPLTWELRLRIAVEVAGAVAYLHSAAAIPIYHRDIKTTNILLDDKYRAKVSDFGTSRSIPVDQTHLTTLVQGTFGYLDPEYFRTSQFTEKSDVYSFGVVIVELLTGQKPILSARSVEEGKSLAAYFILAMKENRLEDILNARVLKEGGKEEVLAVAKIAKRCLNMNGRKRPTMREVMMELEGIRMSNGALTPVMENHCEEDEYAIDDLTGPWEPASSSTGSYFSGSTIQVSDVKPLLFDK